MLGMVEFVSTLIEVHRKAVENWDYLKNSGVDMTEEDVDPRGEAAVQKSTWNWFQFHNEIYETIRGGLLQDGGDILDYKRLHSWTEIFNDQKYAFIRKYIPECMKKQIYQKECERKLWQDYTPPVSQIYAVISDEAN